MATPAGAVSNAVVMSTRFANEVDFVEDELTRRVVDDAGTLGDLLRDEGETCDGPLGCDPLGQVGHRATDHVELGFEAHDVGPVDALDEMSAHG